MTHRWLNEIHPGVLEECTYQACITIVAMDAQLDKAARTAQTQPGQPETARVIIEVVAGVIPERPIPEYTRRYVITSTEWAVDPEERSGLLAERNGRAQGYAGLLMLQPDVLNWVRTDWIWL